MSRSPAVPLAIVVAVLCGSPFNLSAAERSALSGSEAECREGEVGLVIPAFSDNRLGGEVPEDDPRWLNGDALGQQVATVLNLQIWQTLRKSDDRGSDFGRGVVVWDPQPLREPSFAAAEQEARDRQCQLVFWGRAWTYGDDVVAQAYLSIMDRPVLWRTQVELADGPSSLELGFPRRRYEFAPIVLAPDVVESFSQPSALQLMSEPRGGVARGRLGLEFIALRQDPDAAMVESNGRMGWVQLPQLSRNRSEVVDFTGGVVRLLRQDWHGARELLQLVIDNPATPASLAIDSLLLQAVASERLGSDGWPMIERAYERNPHSRLTARYGLLHRLSSLADKRSREERTERERAALERALAETRHLFAADDPWVVGAHNALDPR